MEGKSKFIISCDFCKKETDKIVECYMCGKLTCLDCERILAGHYSDGRPFAHIVCPACKVEAAYPRFRVYEEKEESEEKKEK